MKRLMINIKKEVIFLKNHIGRKPVNTVISVYFTQSMIDAVSEGKS